MPAGGDYQIDTHPGLGRRMMVAACIAFGLTLLGLFLSAHAAPLPAAGPAAMSQSAEAPVASGPVFSSASLH